MQTSPAPRGLPTHELIQQGNVKSGMKQGIRLHGWTITSEKASICNSTEMDNIQKDIGIPPPEMVFGSNRITFATDKVAIEFNAYDALRYVDTSPESSEYIKVAYANEWTRKSTANHTNIKDVVKPYDWTYTTTYKGTVLRGGEFEQAEEPQVDFERLKQKEPILFYNENILYEDELADNGTTMLSIRLRVMPSCFLILQRLFLRVDDVLFRINDTRIYHEFGAPYVVREYTSKEETFYNVLKKLPAAKKDVSMLNDPNWVSSILPPEPKVFTRERLACT
ncbi:hypothetical protein VTP01DRAFT_1930 [Rhizomucor pusillus]|uniref:uncharacterized protein n=1 Tax=Rhizomucor pusillus TaxID=4840 RepID=UPI0037427993